MAAADWCSVQRRLSPDPGSSVGRFRDIWFRVLKRPDPRTSGLQSRHVLHSEKVDSIHYHGGLIRHQTFLGNKYAPFRCQRSHHVLFACDFSMKICYVNRTLYFCALVFLCNFFCESENKKKQEGLFISNLFEHLIWILLTGRFSRQCLALEFLV